MVRDRYKSTADLIKLKDLEKVPNAVYDFCPENARRTGGDACLCFSCESTRLHDKARHATGSYLSDYIGKLEEVGTTASPQLAELAAALQKGSKGDFVRAITCGGTGTDLAERAGKCTGGCDVKCEECSFARLWSTGARRTLFTKGGELKKELSSVWEKRVFWSEYVKQAKTTTTRAAADEDAAYELKKKVRTETVVKEKNGTPIEFIDALELVAEKHVYHRGILARQVRAAAEMGRNYRPGMLCLNMDFAENPTI